MRYLRIQDFTRQANVATAMSDLATFKIPKGMVYAFSTRMNLSIFVVEKSTTDSPAAAVLDALTSRPVQCSDLGGSNTALEDMKDQIAVYINGTYNAAGDIAWATSIITMDEAPGAVTCDVFYCSTLNLQPTIATAADNGILEIRAEAPAGQNIGIPIFSGDLWQIQANTQKSDVSPLRLDGAVLLPEGFILAIKVNAASVAITDTAYIGDTTTNYYKDDSHCIERMRIPYDRFALKDFPRDFKARVLAAMAVS